jgi:hypothetical protein
VPDSSTTNALFAIGHAGRFRTDNSNSFAGFVTALSADLNGTTAVIDLAANGQYDSAKNTFTAARIVVVLSNKIGKRRLPPAAGQRFCVHQLRCRRGNGAGKKARLLPAAQSQAH